MEERKDLDLGADVMVFDTLLVCWFEEAAALIDAVFTTSISSFLSMRSSFFSSSLSSANFFSAMTGSLEDYCFYLCSA